MHKAKPTVKKDRPCKVCARPRQMYFAASSTKCADCIHRANPDGFLVYGFLCEGFIKIGHTGSLRNRMDTIRQTCPFDVTEDFAVQVGSKRLAASLEKHLHRELKEYSHKGEWFVDSPQFRVKLNSLIKGDNLPPIIHALSEHFEAQESK